MRIRCIDDPNYKNGKGRSSHYYYMYEGTFTGVRGSRGWQLENVVISPLETKDATFEGVASAGQYMIMECRGVPLRAKPGIYKVNQHHLVGMWEPVLIARGMH